MDLLEDGSTRRAVLWQPRLHSVMPIQVMCEVLQAYPEVLAEIRRETGLDEEKWLDPDTLVSQEQILKTYSIAAHRHPDPLFAFRVGMSTRTTFYGMYGFAVLSSPNFRSTIQLAVLYQGFASQLGHLQYQDRPGAGVWVFEPYVHPLVDAVVSRFIIEHTLGCLITAHRDILGADFQPTALRARFGRGDSCEAINRYLVDELGMTNVEFSCAQPHNEFQLEASWLDVRPQFGNPIAHASVRRACDELEQRREALSGTSARVWHLLVERFGRSPGLPEMARLMNTSERTLRRNLRDEGTTFHQLCDQVRAQIAMKYLRDTRLTVESIALAMGYEEASNFRRAFRRWTSKTPMAYRHSFDPT